MEKSLSYAAPSGLYVTPKHQPGPGPHGAGVSQTQVVSCPQQQGDQTKHRGRNLQVGCAWRPPASHKGTHSLQPRWQHKHRTKLRTDPDQHQMIASPGCQQSSTALAAEVLLGASLTLTCRATVLSLEHKPWAQRGRLQGCLSGVRVGEKTHFSPQLGAELEAGLHEVLSPSLAKSCWHNSELEVKCVAAQSISAFPGGLAVCNITPHSKPQSTFWISASC